MNQTYKLPPRKWYTLEQAIKRIKQLTGEELEIVDLLHYWRLSMLEISVELSLHQKAFISGKEILSKTKRIDFYEDYSIEYDKDDDKPNITFGIDDVYLCDEEYEKFNGLCSICFINYEYNSFDEAIFCEKNIELDTILLVSQKDEFGKYAIMIFELDEKNKFSIDIKDLFLLESSIQKFINGKLPNIFLGKDNSKKLSCIGRKTEIKSLVLSIAKATFAKNPQQSRHKIAITIHKYIEDEYSEEYNIPDERTIINYLKEAEIGRENIRNKEKVTIVDPFKQV